MTRPVVNPSPTWPEMVAGLLAALPDPVAEIRIRSQLCREAYELGRGDGFDEGSTAMATAYKRALLGRYAGARTEALRWHVCCRSCRMNGHRDGCTRCEDRARAAAGDPHPDDYVPAEHARLEPAS